MTNYTYNRTGDTAITLWTQGESDGAYRLEISIADTSGGTLATATLAWTDDRGQNQQTTVGSKPTNPQAVIPHTWEQTAPPEQLATMHPAITEPPTASAQSWQGDITVKASTEVTVEVVCDTRPVYASCVNGALGDQLAESYTLEVSTEP